MQNEMESSNVTTATAEAAVAAAAADTIASQHEQLTTGNGEPLSEVDMLRNEVAALRGELSAVRVRLSDAERRYVELGKEMRITDKIRSQVKEKIR